jgi:hypothetical protein
LSPHARERADSNTKVSSRRGSAAVVALLLAGCNPAFRPAVPPEASTEGVQVRIESMDVGGIAPPVRPLGASLGLVVRVHGEAGTKLEKALLTRTTRAECTGGSPALRTVVDGAAAKLPVPLEGEKTLLLGFFPSVEEALEGPTALDLLLDVGGGRTCVRTPLGPASEWQRTQWGMAFSASGGMPLRTVGDVGTVWSIDARIGALLGRVDLSAGVRVGVASCGECYQNAAVLDGPVVAATLYPVTSRRTMLGVELSYAALLEQIHYPQDPTGSDPTLREWFQVPGVALQWDWVTPPRGSRVRLRDHDFNTWGVQVFDQLWVPTLHPDRPGTVLGLGLVGRLAF